MAQRSNFQIDDIKINKRGNAFFMDIDATLDEPNCRTAFKDWLDSEYKETEIDWDKVPVDTPVFVWGDNRKTLKEDIFRLMQKAILFMKHLITEQQAGLLAQRAAGNIVSWQKWKTNRSMLREWSIKCLQMPLFYICFYNFNFRVGARQ